MEKNKLKRKETKMLNKLNFEQPVIKFGKGITVVILLVLSILFIINMFLYLFSSPSFKNPEFSSILREVASDGSSSSDYSQMDIKDNLVKEYGDRVRAIVKLGLYERAYDGIIDALINLNDKRFYDDYLEGLHEVIKKSFDINKSKSDSQLNINEMINSYNTKFENSMNDYFQEKTEIEKDNEFRLIMLLSSIIGALIIIAVFTLIRIHDLIENKFKN